MAPGYIASFTWLYSQQGDACKLESFCAPFGRRIGEYTFFTKYIFVLDICSQQFGEYMSVEYIRWYGIYHANSWGGGACMLESFCAPFGRSVGDIHFYQIYICIVDCFDVHVHWAFLKYTTENNF